jgi:geranylgeranyl pyrophosphate synthase
MNPYKPPGKIRVSRESRVDILDLLETILNDIANDNYTEPRSFIGTSHHEKVLDLNDLYREIQGIDYVTQLLQKLKEERNKEVDKLLKKVSGVSP